ncbi:tryptophan synthase subunit alpha [Thermoplasma sp. Kam2015]|uniref:tryptophan synthase subunit alpha n=1 Tax=Thermoplasma sp. Kam2015 TaxID=2094122 RepID=UPI001F030A6D|nr:tryptophan synthase subunit alpha [Thermoplasma sp. Kam2015]
MKLRRTHDPSLNMYSENENAEVFRMADELGSRKYSLMYYEVLKSRGTRILDYLNRNGFDGSIIPDLMIDHREAFYETVELLRQYSLEYVPFVTPITPTKIMQDQISAGGDWIYQGMMPATGVQLPYSIDTIYEHLKPFAGGRHIVYGFGIRDMETMKKLAKYDAFGIAVGTAVVEMIDSGDTVSYRSLVDMILEA